jgi:2-C-methyl-D-erythritol 4-phosphate cytidylyltransferase/2-C-methyl-D-erythritol 2,4-cyclodiphosphate synthase
MFVSSIIVAAGRSQRFGGGTRKQLLSIAGRSVLERSIAVFVGHPRVDELVVALPADLTTDVLPYLRARAKPIQVVAGGDRRQDSVANAFRAISHQSDLVVIHDAARPFVSADLITRTIEAAAETGAALAAMPSRDTVKRGTRLNLPDDSQPGEPDRRELASREWFVGETLPRELIFLAQTPQAFRRRVLGEALALVDAGLDVTDEATLAERAGHPVRIVMGEPTNVKLTSPEDLTIAEAIARRNDSAPAAGRAGTGYDSHRLVSGRPLMLGGISIPSDKGGLGYSDADVVCHAIVDALLGATGLGDIGRHFPNTDPRWKGAPGLDLLSRAFALVDERGVEVGNVDATVILESPKIQAYVEQMREAVARAIGVDPAQVSIKGKTNEGLDAIGRGEAIAAHAIAFLVPKARPIS